METIYILNIESQFATEDEFGEWCFARGNSESAGKVAFSTFDELRVYAYQWFNNKKIVHRTTIASGRVVVDETHHIDVASRPNAPQVIAKAMPEMSMVFHRTDGSPRKMYIVGHSSVSTLVLNPQRED